MGPALKRQCAGQNRKIMSPEKAYYLREHARELFEIFIEGVDNSFWDWKPLAVRAFEVAEIFDDVFAERYGLQVVAEVAPILAPTIFPHADPDPELIPIPHPDPAPADPAPDEPPPPAEPDPVPVGQPQEQKPVEPAGLSSWGRPVEPKRAAYEFSDF